MNASKLLFEHVASVVGLNRLTACSAAAALANVSATAAAGENFEGFTGASGASATSFGNINYVSGNSVINSDATAYDGTHYLQLNDQTPAEVYVDTGFYDPKLTANGAKVSFALRVEPKSASDSTHNTAQVVIKSTSGILAQLGILTDGSFNYFPYSGSGAGDIVTLPGITPTPGTWYVFTLVYTVAPTGASTSAGTYSLKITDTKTKVSTNFTNLTGQTAFTSLAPVISEIRYTTGGAATGNVDIDAINVEPAP